MSDKISADSAAKCAAAIFSSDEGKTLLQYLRQDTIEQPNLPSQAMDGIGMGYLMSVLEGEKNLCRKIERLIKKGKEIS